MNHCPVYARIGGHAYGTTYPGPIGAIMSPHMLGLECHLPAGVCLYPVRRVQRGVPGQDSHHRHFGALAQ
jgi:hypothetical protein